MHCQRSLALLIAAGATTAPLTAAQGLTTTTAKTGFTTVPVPLGTGAAPSTAAAALTYFNATSTVTAVLTALTTYCPSPTVIKTNGRDITVSEPGTVTITDCPCTVVSKVPVLTSTYCPLSSSAPAGDNKPGDEPEGGHEPTGTGGGWVAPTAPSTTAPEPPIVTSGGSASGSGSGSGSLFSLVVAVAAAVKVLAL